jgi:hypothetical protein
MVEPVGFRNPCVWIDGRARRLDHIFALSTSWAIWILCSAIILLFQDLGLVSVFLCFIHPLPIFFDVQLGALNVFIPLSSTNT